MSQTFSVPTLEEILSNRERRACRQTELLAEFSVPLISFTLNIPGPRKNSPLIQRCFHYGINRLRESLPQNSVLFRETREEATGCEALFAVDLPSEEIKKICLILEEETPLGRLFDLDVLRENGEKLCREKERGCLVCQKAGRFCAASRAHSAEEVYRAAEDIMKRHFEAEDKKEIARLAAKSLKDEVLTTPKPGLVDQRNNGSHKDMDLSLFFKSAEALAPYFSDCVAIGIASREEEPNDVFSLLRKRGILAEKEMFAATNGVNTHKGAIFSLGILCGAIGRLWTAENPVPSIERTRDLCRALVRDAMVQDFSSAESDSAGKKLYRTLGLTGIRGEAAEGFPSVFEIALPCYRSLLSQGLPENEAGRTTLLHLIATVEDTTLYHRGGKEGAAFAKKSATELFKQKEVPSQEEIEALDDAFIEKNLSPGGCADLLAATYFLHSLSQYQ